MFLIQISSLFFCFVLIHADPLPDANELSIITTPEQHDQIEVGTHILLDCHLNQHGTVWWMKNNTNISSPDSRPTTSTWEKKSADVNDTGDYVCVAKTKTENFLVKKIHITVIEPPEISTDDQVRAKVGERASLGCHLRGDSMSNLNWEKIGEPGITEYLNSHTNTSHKNETHITTILNLARVDHGDNGTYVCSARTGNNSIVNSTKYLFVTDIPEIEDGKVKSVGADSIYLNWTINEHNEPILEYIIESQEETKSWRRVLEKIDTGESGVVVKGLRPNTSYKFRITAKNSVGSMQLPMTLPEWTKTFEKDPELVPHYTVKKTTNHSITIEFTEPPTNLKDFTYFHKITVTQGIKNPQTNESNANNKFMTIEGLQAETNYKIRLAACNYYTRRCGNWSAEKQVLTTNKNAMSSSSDLHTTGLIFLAINTLSLYLSIKYLTT